MTRTDRASLVVHAPPLAVFAALTSRTALRSWLPSSGRTGRIVSTVPGVSVVAAVGATTVTWTLSEALGGTLVSVEAADVPAEVSSADHDAWMRSSLAQLAAYLARPIASTPEPPYTAVIFTSVLGSSEGYAEMAARMEALAARQPGYLGIESARSEVGVTISYWVSEDAARAWKGVAEHVVAQERGREEWYAAYRVRIATVTRDY